MDSGDCKFITIFHWLVLIQCYIEKLGKTNFSILSSSNVFKCPKYKE